MPDKPYVCPFEVLAPGGPPSAFLIGVDLGTGTFTQCAVFTVGFYLGKGGTRFYRTLFRDKAARWRPFLRGCLPLRQAAADAEDDLREYAAKKGWFIHRKEAAR
jgi:hypothetical protein